MNESFHVQSNPSQMFHQESTRQEFTYYEPHEGAPTHYNARNDLNFDSMRGYPGTCENSMPNSFIRGNVARVRPMMRRSASPVGGQCPQTSGGSDEFVLYGSMKRVLSSGKKYQNQKNYDNE